MSERRSDREIVLTSSQILVILVLLIILLSVVFVLGISVGRTKKQASFVEEKLPPVVIKEEKPEEKKISEPSSEPERTEELVTDISRFFYVQVGGFSSEESAKKVADEFREKGYAVRIFPPSPQDKPPLYRVRVGPYLRIEEAKEVLKKLKKTGKEDYWIWSEERK